MPNGSQRIQLARDGVVVDGIVEWSWASDGWTVEIAAPGLDGAVETADDAFEALCRIRERVEPEGWRVGVVGAQRDVWPSGMARDQGGGVVAYRMTAAGAGEVVQVFAPVSPETVVAIGEQRRQINGTWAGLAG